MRTKGGISHGKYDSGSGSLFGVVLSQMCFEFSINSSESTLSMLTLQTCPQKCNSCAIHITNSFFILWPSKENKDLEWLDFLCILIRGKENIVMWYWIQCFLANGKALPWWLRWTSVAETDTAPELSDWLLSSVNLDSDSTLPQT